MSEAKARRATEAYRIAERLGRSGMMESEWRRICSADYTRRSFHAFPEFLRTEDDIEDAVVEQIRPDNDNAYMTRALYLLSAVAVGTFSLIAGSLLLI
ncbi:hypothetical protein [uncultured Brevundimonas sp.]|uniref:hypothetical protein n=1 Tax=uncultured Brevundimonas sp. TaxID=213418 RepID=UPI0026224476|nr:hypothetical protein [uncultured Brevundimonas sp.]